MNTTTPFKWRHFQAETILLCVRWYLRYPLSYRDLEEMMRERGLHVDHTTIYVLSCNTTHPNWRKVVLQKSERKIWGHKISRSCSD